MSQPLSNLGRRLRPGAWLLIGLAALYAVGLRLATVHHDWLANFAMVGALALFAGARLRLPWACLVTLAVMAVSNALLYWWRDFDEVYRPRYFSPGAMLIDGSFLLYVLLGWAARHTESPWRVGGLAVAGSTQFYLITNFGAWLGQALPYSYTPEGLLSCYVAALPFYGRTLMSDLVFTGVLFGAHAILSRTVFPTERVVRPEGATV